jgi:prefoldin beta subunit
MTANIQQQLMEFEQGRAQLGNISVQKQQLQIQATSIQQSLDELGKTKEKTVFKAVGNILINADTTVVKKELEEKKESLDLRLKSVEKQEQSLVNKLNKIKAELEQAQATQQASGPDTVVETESGKKGESA